LTFQLTGAFYSQIRLSGGSSTGATSCRNIFIGVKEAADASSSCVNLDTDNDGIPNRLDLDSDNDDCSDAFEAGSTKNTTTNFKFPGSYGANGLDNILETATDNGIVNYTLTYSRPTSESI